MQTIYGNVLCKIREGTQSGSKIRLRGKGIVSMKDPSVHGDQYVKIEVQVPRNLSPEAKQKLRGVSAALPGRRKIRERQRGVSLTGRGNKLYEKRGRRSAAFLIASGSGACVSVFFCVSSMRKLCEQRRKYGSTVF